MKFTILAALAVSPAFATFVVQCTSRLVDDRLDPLVYPNEISDHVHVIAGGNAFGPTLDYEEARASSCSTCHIEQDLSNYWTPKLYYQDTHGNFTAVPIDGDDSLGNMGGMAIYYLPRRGPDNDELVPFPKGFRMFAGDSMKRTETKDFAGQAVRHRCVGGSGEFTSLPNKVCPQGVRTEIVFPSCWDGVNLDSADHKSHVSYPKDGNYDGGRCPASHPKHLLTLFYEVTYRTDMFQWHGDKQPFVFSNGDPTGFGYHGDFINGWDVGKLAEAIKKCPDGSHECDPGGSVFTFNSPGDRQACKLPQRVVEQVSGVLAELPGCNDVSTDPVMVQNCPRNPQKILAVGTLSGVPDLSSKGWEYTGCGVDDPQAWSTRALVGGQQNLEQMTVTKCVEACSAAGFSYAGLEFASECYCGKTIDKRAAPKAGILGNCNMKCAGDSTQNCGGSKAISLYQKCTGGVCTNTGLGSEPSTGDPAVPPPAQGGPPSPSTPVIAPITSKVAPVNTKSSHAPVNTPTTLSTVTKAPVKSTLHTRTRTTTYVSTVTETYWT